MPCAARWQSSVLWCRKGRTSTRVRCSPVFGDPGVRASARRGAAPSAAGGRAIELTVELDRQLSRQSTVGSWPGTRPAGRARISPPFRGLVRSCRARWRCGWHSRNALPRRARPGRLDRAGAPKQASSRGDTVRLGRISKAGRCLLAPFADQWRPERHPATAKRRAKTDPCGICGGLLATKPRLVVAVALANKMARIAWAVMVRATGFPPRSSRGLIGPGWGAWRREACRGERCIREGSMGRSDGVGQTVWCNNGTWIPQA